MSDPPGRREEKRRGRSKGRGRARGGGRGREREREKTSGAGGVGHGAGSRRVEAAEDSARQPSRSAAIGSMSGGSQREAAQGVHGQPPSTEPKVLESAQSTAADETKPISSAEGAPPKAVQQPVAAKLMKLQHQPLPARQGYGTKGSPVLLKTNLFPVKYPSRTVYHYNVTLNPECSKRISRIVFERIMELNQELIGGQKPAFDGSKNMFTSEQLKIPEGEVCELSGTFCIEKGDREKLFVVKLQLVAQIDLSWIEDNSSDPTLRMQAIQALDIVIRHTPSLRFVQVGRSFFTPPKDITRENYLGDGCVVWSGFYTSLRPAALCNLVLNMDVSNTAFYQDGSALDFMKEVLGGRIDLDRPLVDSDRVRFAKEIKGLKVFVTHLPYPRKYTVAAVTRCSATEQTFPLDDGTSCTVEEYFSKTYEKQLRHPHMPCLHASHKTNKHVYLPLELCGIVSGQKCSKKLKEQQTRKMIKETAKPAYMRRKCIMEKVSDADFKRDEQLIKFEISVDTRMVEVSGRVLPSPVVQYSDSGQVTPTKGSWRMEGEHFIQGAKVDKWVVVVFAQQRFCKEETIRKFVKEVCKTGEGMGMAIDPPLELIYFRDGRDTVDKCFDRFLSKFHKLQLVIAVLGWRGISHDEVKLVGNVKGVQTQCVKSETVERKCNHSVLSNLCLKINAKLGGVNNIIDPSLSILHKIHEPVIVMGADVTHPSPGDKKKPSIAALTASMNKSASLYKAEVRVQQHRQEMIAEMENLVYDMLVEFDETTCDGKAKQIIFYRDGVSEGQFREVMEVEINAIRRACARVAKDYKPGITFLVVQKRHHVRFFPVRREDGIGGSANVPPGTVVDGDVTHPTEHDFYLCSHFGIQGTSRPSHYHVLCDENGFTADDLQQLSYELCHLYFRCNRSVSYPAPAYYAHLAAFRARQAWEGKDSRDSASMSSLQSDVDYSHVDLAWSTKVHDKVKCNMYFL